MGQFSFEQKIEIVSKMALDYCEENGLKFKQYNQKFAELIVQECIDICNKIYFENYPDAEDFECSEEGDAIKRHFGVKL